MQFDEGGFPLTFVDPGKLVLRGSTRHLIGGARLVLLMLLLPLTALAAPGEPAAAGGLAAPSQMMSSLESALAGHRAERAYLKTRVGELEDSKSALQDEINAYNSLGSHYSQLLLVPRIEREQIGNALVTNRLVSRRLIEGLKALEGHYESTLSLFKENAARTELVRKQSADIPQSQLPDAKKRELEATIRTLRQVLQEKKKLADRYQHIYEDLKHRLNTELDQKKALGEMLSARMKTYNRTFLFTRTNFYTGFSEKAFRETWDYSTRRLKAVFSPAIWQTQWFLVKMGGFANWSVFLLLFVSIVALQGRFRALLRRIEKRGTDSPDWYHGCLGLCLLRRSLLYIGMALLFGIYSSAHLALLDIGLGRILFYMFLFLLLTRWGLDTLAFGFRGQPTELRSYVTVQLKWFFRFFCGAILASILLTWIAGRSSLLAWAARIILSAVFLVWAVFFWRQMKIVVARGVRIGLTAPNPRRVALCKWWFYIVFGGHLLFYLLGYGQLAGHWMFAWVGTVALLFWAWLLRQIIREWDRNHRVNMMRVADDEHSLSITDELSWSLIQLVRLLWFVGLAAGLAWTWDSSGVLFLQLKRFVDSTVAIGSLNLSAKGIVLAALIIYLTRLVVYIGRSLIDEIILDKRTLEQGLRDSMLTIVGYLIWGLGLILALGILGVNATSLAIVFGALSVGIGFGLQTIFNNFFSGLILLFERPIQVGDTIEVNGLWATVKKINVRATVVQTFDNASVIIPNSELISQQVTNWSFKDKRIRCNMEVGVAYGSDIDLVKATLKEIVKKNPKILKRPEPDVLFTEHANSALIFRLRIWVHLDDYWQVPSQVRCEIDKRFHELAIEIAFPQRDLHIRTLPQERVPAAAEDSDGAQPAQKPVVPETPGTK
jgi:potassium efflux system protein